MTPLSPMVSMNSIIRIALHILMLLVPCVALAWEGKVIAIDRGDQIQVMKDIGKVETVRLYGIDSPGEPQPFGQAARLYTHKRILGKIVRVDPIITDPFNRVIAWVYIDGESFNKELLRKGMAWWYRKYLPFEMELADLEEQARKEKIGLWAHPSPIPPWEFHPPTTPSIGQKEENMRLGKPGMIRQRLKEMITGPEDDQNKKP
jgi:micrococcal nuclease